MPYPAQVKREALIETAREMIEATGGAERVSLAMLAAAFGIKAPALYRHVSNKADLLQAVNAITHQQMTARLYAAAEETAGGPREQVLAMGKAYYDFALENPVTYRLAYAGSAETDPDPAFLAALAVPLQQVMAQLVGDAASLTGLRGLWALVHGFVMLEIQGRFRRGGDLKTTFTQILEAYIDGWAGRT